MTKETQEPWQNKIKWNKRPTQRLHRVLQVGEIVRGSLTLAIYGMDYESYNNLVFMSYWSINCLGKLEYRHKFNCKIVEWGQYEPLSPRIILKIF